MRTVTVMHRIGLPAVRTRPLLRFLLQKSIHTYLPDHPQVLQRRLPVRILRHITVLLLHNVFAREIRTFITVLIVVLLLRNIQ